LKYVIYLLIATVVFAIGSSIYDELNKRPLNAKRLDCHKGVALFEQKQGERFDEVRKLLKEGSYRITSSIQKSIYMESKLFEKISVNDVDRFIAKVIGEPKGDQVEIEYFIYENDKLHPGKKGEKSKLFSGYLNFKFKIDGESQYQVQIDFLDIDGKDIKSRVECLFESLFSY